MDFWNSLLFHTASLTIFLMIVTFLIVPMMLFIRVMGKSTKKTVRVFKK